MSMMTKWSGDLDTCIPVQSTKKPKKYCKPKKEKPYCGAKKKTKPEKTNCSEQIFAVKKGEPRTTFVVDYNTTDVFFSCQYNFNLVRGDLHRHCQINGQWSGSQPYCEPVTPSYILALFITSCVGFLSLVWLAVDFYFWHSRLREKNKVSRDDSILCSSKDEKFERIRPTGIIEKSAIVQSRRCPKYRNFDDEVETMLLMQQDDLKSDDGKHALRSRSMDDVIHRIEEHKRISIAGDSYKFISKLSQTTESSTVGDVSVSSLDFDVGTVGTVSASYISSTR